MTSKSNDNLKKALTLLKQTARGAQPPTKRAPRGGGPPDLGELFLAELRMRRAHLREWIEMLNQEADGEAAPRFEAAAVRLAPQTCRGTHRHAYRAR